MSAGYAAAAALYQSKDWHPLPLLNGKGLVPPGFTGYAARYPTDAEVAEWCQEYPDNGLCLRLGYEIGLDVDDYETKAHAAGEGTRSLAALEREYGALPPTWVSSGRFASGDMGSGIRYYRLPERFHELAHERVWHGRPAIEGTMLPGIDVIRLGHRQAVVSPTVHKSGHPYRWLNGQTGEIRDDPPALDDIPFLSEPWLEALIKRPGTGQKATPKAARQRRQASPPLPSEWWTDGEPCRAVAEALDKWTIDLGSGRHEAMTRSMTALTRLGEQGHHGVAQAVQTFRDSFLAAVEDEPDRYAEAEWERAVDGVDLLIEDDGLTLPENKGCCPDPVDDPLADLEDAVFAATETLCRIRQGARARLASPWGVLGDVLARVASETDPSVQLPPIVGSAASLNVAVGLVGPSGGGKGIAHDVGGELFGWEFAHQIGPGTGEGIMQTFLVWDKDSQDYLMADNRCSLLYADEIAQIGATQARNGATIGPIIRSMWSGKAVSTTNADRKRRRHLSAHSYRLAIVAGVQPELSSILLDDADAGTPQRWLWLPVVDPSMPDTEPDWPGPIPRHSDDHGNGFDVQPGEGPFSWSAVLDVAHSIQSFIKDEHRKRQRGDQGGLDGHMLLTRLKVAGLLALLHETGSIDERWWDLAGLVVEASRRTRRLCQEAVARGMAQQTVDRGRADERRATGARLERAEQNEKLARLLFKTVSNGEHPNAKHHPEAGCTRRCFTHALRHHHAADADDVIQTALRLCWIEEDEDGRWRPGDSQPA